ncbi:TetR/AcrR family transcriptional regulator [Chitinophaga ginsengisoli]|uniref:TetR family transcriptional regulator n=1 Tax=Chitinophaga ginsengisoli TaxID=363837 RepID=A0A2P8G2B8_9BACT|nr:TetR/AcrR family transcriptional regulator [Chitinophaga ginsengisoli]PSL28128.1 TetR family transcriptional regulator [Chitinophaga ginsengisoli]
MKKSEKTRQFIIEQTAPIFNTKGVAATVVADVMQATNMARGGLYVHFKDLEELSQCAAEWNLKQFVEKTSAEAARFVTAKDKFFGMLDYLSDPLNPPIQGGCPMMNLGMEADDTSPVIREMVNETICTVQQGMIDILKQGVDDGEFLKDWNYKEFALKAYAMVEGGILVSRVSRDISQMKMLVNLLKKEIESVVVSTKKKKK